MSNLGWLADIFLVIMMILWITLCLLKLTIAAWDPPFYIWFHNENQKLEYIGSLIQGVSLQFMGACFMGEEYPLWLRWIFGVLCMGVGFMITKATLDLAGETWIRRCKENHVCLICAFHQWAIIHKKIEPTRPIGNHECIGRRSA